MTTSRRRQRFDWYIDHPVKYKMKQWNFEDSIRVQAAFTVYLDLCEAKTWWNVDIHPCQELQMVYITGKPEKKADFTTVLPVRAQEEMSVRRMDDFLRCIPPPAKKEKTAADVSDSLSKIGPHVIVLAFVDSDSTIVYYNISNGLQQPKNLEETDEAEEEKKPKKSNRGQKRGSKRFKKS